MTPVDNPLEELQALAGRVLAWERAIGELVNGLSEIRYESEHGGEQFRVEVALLERAMDRCERVMVAMARRLRLVAAQERQAIPASD